MTMSSLAWVSALKDSMGNGSVIVPGDVQRMSAGTGVTHSEYNPSETEGVHFLQIWLEPNELGVKPGYDQKHFSRESRLGQFVLLVSPDGRNGSISSHQDALLYGAVIAPEQQVSQSLHPDRKAYLHVAKGLVSVDGCQMKAGDGLKIQLQEQVTVTGLEDAEVLLFDLP